MGNPHCVVFVEDAENFPIFEIGHSFEIHEKLGEQTSKLLKAEGFKDVELRHDFRGKPRMICCRKK